MGVVGKAVLLLRICWLMLLSWKTSGFKLFHILERKGEVLLLKLLQE
jgi:hypothetical protein